MRKIPSVVRMDAMILLVGGQVDGCQVVSGESYAGEGRVEGGGRGGGGVEKGQGGGGHVRYDGIQRGEVVCQ